MINPDEPTNDEVTNDEVTPEEMSKIGEQARKYEKILSKSTATKQIDYELSSLNVNYEGSIKRAVLDKDYKLANDLMKEFRERGSKIKSEDISKILDTEKDEVKRIKKVNRIIAAGLMVLSAAFSLGALDGHKPKNAKSGAIFFSKVYVATLAILAIATTLYRYLKSKYGSRMLLRDGLAKQRALKKATQEHRLMKEINKAKEKLETPNILVGASNALGIWSEEKLASSVKRYRELTDKLIPEQIEKIQELQKELKTERERNPGADYTELEGSITEAKVELEKFKDKKLFLIELCMDRVARKSSRYNAFSHWLINSKIAASKVNLEDQTRLIGAYANPHANMLKEAFENAISPDEEKQLQELQNLVKLLELQGKPAHEILPEESEQYQKLQKKPLPDLSPEQAQQYQELLTKQPFKYRRRRLLGGVTYSVSPETLKKRIKGMGPNSGSEGETATTTSQMQSQRTARVGGRSLEVALEEGRLRTSRSVAIAPCDSDESDASPSQSRNRRNRRWN